MKENEDMEIDYYAFMHIQSKSIISIGKFERFNIERFI